MKGILADINIQGQVNLLVRIMQADPWKLFWDDLSLKYASFADLGLADKASDSLVWETCQLQEFVLVTDNRNQKTPDSLEATIRAKNTNSSSPVFTIANVPHLSDSRQYAERVIEKMLDYLLRMDDLLGTGRLFLP
ncbi:MAG: hypothetical protein L0Y72_28715 [Gemmataceae bacterium]|nr:hypothetical protein [Gemmataceae bacterium]MCI0743031.1 hypothetical protein [Gemmataceae bacterium]